MPLRSINNYILSYFMKNVRRLYGIFKRHLQNVAHHPWTVLFERVVVLLIGIEVVPFLSLYFTSNGVINLFRFSSSPTSKSCKSFIKSIIPENQIVYIYPRVELLVDYSN